MIRRIEIGMRQAKPQRPVRPAATALASNGLLQVAAATARAADLYRRAREQGSRAMAKEAIEQATLGARFLLDVLAQHDVDLYRLIDDLVDARAEEQEAPEDP